MENFDLRKNLIKEIKGFLKKTGMKKSRFGVLTMNDGNFVKDLNKGRDVHASTYQKVVAFITSNKV